MTRQRICVLGPSCSGKSTLSEKLGKKLKYPVLHIDQIAHIPGTKYVKRPHNELVKIHNTFIKKQTWVIDGQFIRLMPARLERADTLILIKANRFACLWNFLKRCLSKKDRSGGLKNAQAEFNLPHIWFILYQQPKRQPELMSIIAQHPHLKTIVLSSFKEMNSFLENVY
jgi:adenylate kinase family enzyme